LKRQTINAQGGRGVRASPQPSARTPQQRLNRILLIGGGGLAAGAVLVALLARHFDPIALGVNLAAIGVGLLMGMGIGRFIFRRTSGASLGPSGALRR
jgi:hypothetical protein